MYEKLRIHPGLKSFEPSLDRFLISWSHNNVKRIDFYLLSIYL